MLFSADGHRIKSYIEGSVFKTTWVLWQLRGGKVAGGRLGRWSKEIIQVLESWVSAQEQHSVLPTIFWAFLFLPLTWSYMHAYSVSNGREVVGGWIMVSAWCCSEWRFHCGGNISDHRRPAPRHPGLWRHRIADVLTSITTVIACYVTGLINVINTGCLLSLFSCLSFLSLSFLLCSLFASFILHLLITFLLIFPFIISYLALCSYS